MAHPAALAAGRSLMAQMGGAGAAGPLPVGSEPNYSTEADGDAGTELSERQRADEGRQRREFLERMAEHGLADERPARSRRRERDEDDDEDDDEPRSTRYDDEEEPAPRVSRRIKKALNIAQSMGLSKKAIEAMDDGELLAFARKQSRRESRLNRVPKGTAREKSERSSTQAGDVEPEREVEKSILKLPNRDVLKGHAKKLAEARGWSDEDADALTAFGEGLLESVKLALEPALQPVVRDQEDRQAAALEDERARLEDRFPELSDDDVHDEVLETAKLLLENGRAKSLKDAYRKAAAIEFDDEDHIAARVEAEIESRSSTHRRKGRPMVPREMRQRPAMSDDERLESGMRGAFDTLFSGGSRAQARRAFQKRTRA